MLRSVGDQEAVHQEPQGQKVAQSQLLAHGHARPRDDLALVVLAVLRRQEHRHVYDVRGRELGGLHVELLLLRRVRGEPEEREQGERDDNLTSVSLGSLARSFVRLAIEIAAIDSGRARRNRAPTTSRRHLTLDRRHARPLVRRFPSRRRKDSRRGYDCS